MNRNVFIIAAVVIVVVLAFSMMRSGGEGTGSDETTPATATD